MRLDADDFLIAGATAVFLMLGAHYARAHSWYDADCCDLTDCRPITGVIEHPNGYHYRNVVIPYGKARQSLDGGYHACFRGSSGEIRTINDVPCFYAPRGSF